MTDQVPPGDPRQMSEWWSEEIQFAVLSNKAKKVHVHDPEKHREMSDLRVFAAGYLGETVCGREILMADRGGWIEEFEDGGLCASCHRLFPGSKALLFEHSVPA